MRSKIVKNKNKVEFCNIYMKGKEVSSTPFGHHSWWWHRGERSVMGSIGRSSDWKVNAFGQMIVTDKWDKSEV